MTPDVVESHLEMTRGEDGEAVFVRTFMVSPASPSLPEVDQTFSLPGGYTMLKPECKGIGEPTINEKGEECYSAFAVTYRFQPE